jgi:hypothetical protein
VHSGLLLVPCLFLAVVACRLKAYLSFRFINPKRLLCPLPQVPEAVRERKVNMQVLPYHLPPDRQPPLAALWLRMKQAQVMAAFQPFKDAPTVTIRQACPHSAQRLHLVLLHDLTQHAGMPTAAVPLYKSASYAACLPA